MSREIKFRVYSQSQLMGIERLDKDGWHWMAYGLNPDQGERWLPGVFHSSLEYTRCQFTGLKDKNGVDIYEGDIVERTRLKKEAIRSIIKFKDGSFRISDSVHLNSGSVYKSELIVIGNVHQNPELLTKL